MLYEAFINKVTSEFAQAVCADKPDWQYLKMRLEALHRFTLYFGPERTSQQTLVKDYFLGLIQAENTGDWASQQWQEIRQISDWRLHVRKGNALSQALRLRWDADFSELVRRWIND